MTWGITKFQGNETITLDAANARVQEINNLFPIPISKGGTGATTPEQARQNLKLETSVILWQNVSGTTGTIYLPEQAANCNRWGIYYGYNSIGGYQECDIVVGNDQTNVNMTYLSNSNNLYIRSALVQYNKSSRQITMSRNQTFVIHENGTHTTSNEQVHIYIVVGYI